MQMSYQPPEQEQDPLKAFTVNMTELARNKKLDPVIGRDSEIRRLMQILSRRTKNNPLLLGDPGVGKTAIVEGLAQRIVSRDVPSVLHDKEVLTLDLASLVAGSAFRGEFEKRIKSLLKKIEEGEGKYILFIDEIHTLVGAGAAEGAVDAANILKPALARGMLHAIGATTIPEYRTYIERDQALVRRFQPIYVEEPSVEDALAILRGLKEKYEVHHGVQIADDALVSAVSLSKRYLPERFLPDKAIDLIDEAASALKIEMDSSPTVIDELNRKIIQDEIEITALKKDLDESVKKRREEKEKNVKKAKMQRDKLINDWTEQKKILEQLNKLRVHIDQKRAELKDAESQAELEKAARIKYGDIPDLKKKLKEAEEEWKKIPEEKRLVKEQVSDEDIARVIAKATGIPVDRLLTSEADRLVHLEKELTKWVIGQQEALHQVARAIRRNRAGLTSPNRPIGTFLFLGPTGVGKTETAKALADTLFSNEKMIVRIDMSEYTEPHSIARLIGAPPGYVGYEEGGQLTEAVRRRPYSVILFDEIEKAHPQVFNLFLQIFDDGRLTDGRGRVVDFSSTIIIMTSNLGSEIILKEGGLTENAKKQINEKVFSFFRPEVLNRIDSVVMFNPVDRVMAQQIVQKELTRVQELLKQFDLSLDMKTDVINYLVDKGFDPVFGARPLRRLIEEEIIDEIASLKIEGRLKEGDMVTVTVEKDVLHIARL
ncbi:MAG: AAA family ATPase [Candidatus Roizmanbacteria bacterium]|nr:AAA family ATPase [Candidatus Roizmanbacteria bacterium]